MTVTLTAPVQSYVASVQRADREAFYALFAEDARVNDAGRAFHGLPQIRDWADREIFEAQVTYEVLDAVESGDRASLTTKVDGNFDRTGLPDPVVIRHEIVLQAGKIAQLTCSLAN